MITSRCSCGADPCKLLVSDSCLVLKVNKCSNEALSGWARVDLPSLQFSLDEQALKIAENQV
jgi:hypothetical protein